MTPENLIPVAPRITALFQRVSIFVFAAFAIPFCLGQSIGSGVIVGRVLNPSSSEYLSNAEIKITGTDQIATSGDGGYYQVSNVPAGTVTVTASFTGFKVETATVTVSAGQTVTHNFELSSLTAKDSVVKLDPFLVASQAAGNAKSIQEQRNSLNIMQSVSSDEFASVADGNISTFLKHLPGVDIVRADGNERNVRLRGLGPEYTAVTINGVSLASADANAGASGSARAQTFEQVNLASMETIELIDTVSANMDANAPAGTINLKTKRAFDREGQQISWLVNSMIFAQESSLKQKVEPDNYDRRRISPGGILEYSNTFLNGRLGVLLNVSESRIFDLVHINTNTYNFTATAADPRPAVLTSILLEDEENITERFGTTATIDFKVTPTFLVSMDFIYNHLYNESPQPKLTFTTGARGTVVGPDPLTNFTASGASIRTAPTSIMKLSQTKTYIPSFQYTLGDLKVMGKFSASNSTSRYNVDLNDTLSNFGTLLDSGITFSAVRSSPTSSDWKIAQVAGPDWSNGANYANGTLARKDGRDAQYEINGGTISATLKTQKVWPVEWEVGGKAQAETVNFDVTTEAYMYNYTGPNSATGSWANIPSPYTLQFSMLGAEVAQPGLNPVFNPSLQLARQLFNQHPEYFTQVETATNYYDAVIGNTKHYVETIDAGYLMATTRVGKLQLRGGLRYEDTGGDSVEFQPQSAAAVTAAGYNVVSGKATTIPGIQYQYQSLPKIHRESDYDNYFPSASAKYTMLEDLVAQVAFSRTIRRPTFSNLTGIFVVNPDNQTATIPNIGLKPENSDNLSARLSYYFKSVGVFSVGVFQNDVKNLILTSTQTAQQFGTTDPTLQGYMITSSVNSVTDTKVRGMEVSYNQNLTFLPRPFTGLSVRASWNRNYAQIIVPSMTPQQITGGFEYALGRMKINADLNWNATTTISTDNLSYSPHRTSIDAGGSFRLTDKTSIFVSANNVTNSQYKQLSRQVTPNVATNIQNWGTFVTFGVKGAF